MYVSERRHGLKEDSGVSACRPGLYIVHRRLRFADQHLIGETSKGGGTRRVGFERKKG